MPASGAAGILSHNMRTKDFRWLFLAVVAALLIIGNVRGPETLGVFYGWTNGRYSFGGGTAPWALALSVVTIVLYLALMYSAPGEEGQPLPGVFRRFVAFWLDFLLATMTVAPMMGILPMLTEWKRTGVFQWDFERTTQFPGDGMVAAIVLPLFFAALVAYYVLPLMCGKPSPGSCILGYQVLPEEGRTLRLWRAIGRTLVGFVALCLAWLAPFLDRDRKHGQFWLDKAFRTRAIKLS